MTPTHSPAAPVPALEAQLSAAIAQTLTELYGQPVAPEAILLQETRKEFAGTYTLVVFPYTRLSKLGPEQTGAQIADLLRTKTDLLAGYNCVKGFLNLELKPQVWQQVLRGVVEAGQHWGQSPATGRRLMVEYSSPNTNKPLHLGHMRNIFLGAALAKVARLAGHTVMEANLVNDRGIHICKSMVAYQRLGHGETPEAAGLKGDHLVGKYYVLFDKHYKAELAELIAGGKSEEAAKVASTWQQAAQESLRLWEAGDAQTLELWGLMNGWVLSGFAESYKRMGVSFDKFYFESDTYLLGKDIVEEGLGSGVFYQQEDGSVWIDLTAEGLDKKLVRRADGTSVYITQDLGTADLKYQDFGMDSSVYVVGSEQDYHFKVLFLILQKMGRPYAPGLFHLSYGMVDLPSGRMKSREGTVVDADDLIDEMIATARARTAELGKFEGMETAQANALYEMLGLGAIKYYLLKVEPAKRMLFNPEESIDLQGNTATAIQYVHARIQSVLRKGAEQGLAPTLPTMPVALEPEETELVRLLYQLPDIIIEAAARYAPSGLATYSYELAKAYNKFFTQHSILSAPTQEHKLQRLAMCQAVAHALDTCMTALGVGLPERM